MKSCYASDRNKGPILGILHQKISEIYTDKMKTQEDVRPLNVLEIASGTGEHANWFLSNIPLPISYQPTEPDQTMHESIKAWLNSVDYSSGKGTNVRPLPVIALDVNLPPPTSFADASFDLMICINMIHISPLSSTEGLFRIASHCIKSNGLVYLYGPYRVRGEMCESNLKFDESLKARNPEWGIRDIEYVQDVAKLNGFRFVEMIDMPSNNFSVIFRKD